MSVQIVIRLKEKNIKTISFLNLSESTESNIPSFLVVLEFIIRIGNAKTLVSAIYMLISIFGSSFIGIGLLGIILSHTFTYAIITIYILNFNNTK